MSDDAKKYPNPGVAAVLSFLFSGLGQIYNGDIAKGLLIMLASTLGLILVIIGAITMRNAFYYEGIIKENFIWGAVFFIIGIIEIMIVGIYNIYDAYNIAKKKTE